MAHFGYEYGTHAGLGLDTITLTCESDAPPTTATFAPSLGCSLLSFTVGAQDYIVAQDATDHRALGTPVLYPSPNRVRDAQFTFEDRTFVFEANNGPNFLHGLVKDATWTCAEPLTSRDSVSATMYVECAPGSEMYELYPIHNRLEMSLTLRPGVLRYDYCAVNLDSESRLPFGLAIHPYFPILGERKDVVIRVPATHWMEAVDLLPTGQLVEIADGPANISQPASLGALDLDDVFLGVTPDGPCTIDYTTTGKRVSLTASDLFTHAVVYTPAGQPFFCIENQSCSTDAHNLHAQGLVDEAHLSILEPGECLRSWIEIAVSDL